MKSPVNMKLSPRSWFLLILGTTTALLSLFFTIVFFLHRVDTLDKENKRLVKEAGQSIQEIQDISEILGRIGDVARNLDRMNYAAGQILAFNSGTELTEPEVMDEPLETELSFDTDCSEIANFSSLKNHAEDLRDKGHILLSFIENVENSVRERNQLLRFIPSILPVDGPISSPFGIRTHPLFHKKRKHNGIDIPAPYGAPVVATADGSVRYVGYNKGYGRMVVVQHGNGLITRYAHNSKIIVKKGQKVEKGQKIAEIGSSGIATGPHSHYEVLLHKTPVNPELFILKTPERTSSQTSEILTQQKHDNSGFNRSDLSQG